MTTLEGVFISYRREDSAAQAGRLFDRISGEFGEDSVFMDVDFILLGTNFFAAIDSALSACRVLLVVIGPKWLDAAQSTGERRIDDPSDLVRMEIEAALRRGITVVPVLIDGAALPNVNELPSSLAELAYRQAVRISHTGFRHESRRLLDDIARVMGRSTDGSALAPKATSSLPDKSAYPVVWSAALGGADARTRVIDIQLSHANHRLEVRSGIMMTVILDGKLIVNRYYFVKKKFDIDDGAHVRRATLVVNTNALWRINWVRLSVDDHVIFEG